MTERPVRPRVSAPAIVEILAYVFMCHTPVTLIKSTYFTPCLDSVVPLAMFCSRMLNIGYASVV